MTTIAGPIERIYLIYAGPSPETTGEIEQLTESLRREGAVLTNTTITAVAGGIFGPDDALAQAFVARCEGEGEVSPGSLGRMTTRSYRLNGAPRMVIVIAAAPAGGGAAADERCAA